MSPLADVDAQRMIDEAISEHEARNVVLRERISENDTAILALKTCRNTHSSISKLPTELIVKIFLHGKNNARLAQSKTGRAIDYMNISSVCRHWREIALDTPQLWCSIDLSWKAERAFEFLKRSKSEPLHVHCPCDYDFARFELVTDTVMLQQIQELNIELKHQVQVEDSLVRLLSLNPSGSAPALEVLKFRFIYWCPPVLLPEGAFWDDMPALRILTLDNILLSSQLPMLPSLTRLVLQCSQGLSESWVLQALRNMPAIEEIDLEGLSSDFTTELSTSPRLSLPKLSSLCITTDHLGSSKIFNYMDYPSSANVEFTYESLPSDSLDFSSLHDLCSLYADRNRETIDRVRIELKDLVVMQLGPSGAGSPPPRLRLAFPLRPTKTVTNSYLAKLSELYSKLPLAAVRTLDLVSYEPESFLTLLPPLKQLTTLYLTNSRAEAFVYLLTADESQIPLVEKLETVVTTQCRFSRSEFIQPDEHTSNAVIIVLKELKEFGTPVQRMEINKCRNVTMGDVKDFEGYVEDVEWDGYQR